MPIFEYVCSVCGRRFEELLVRSDSNAICPDCGSGNVNRLLSVFSAASGATSSPLPCGQSGCGKGFT